MSFSTYGGPFAGRRGAANLARWLAFAVASVCALVISSRPACAQGCIVAHSTQEVTGPETEGGYLAPKHWQLTIDARHQYSFRHFVGPVEQEYRQEIGNEVENKINLFDFALTYQATQRWSFTVTAPVEFATRRSNSSAYTMATEGIGDTPVSTQVWLWKPSNKPRGNIALGVGVQFPTGRSNIKEVVQSSVGGPTSTISDDYSIQPGIGGWAMLMDGQGFKDLGSSTILYADGSYLMTQGGTNHTFVNSSLPPLEQYVAIQDEYLAEIGVAHPIRQVPGLAVTFGPRIEGVPARDIIGNNYGFRRPGFAISLTPGLQWVRHKNIWTFQVGKAMYRDRTRSVPDEIYGTHGDAAFADYVWLASYTYRF